MKLFANHEAKYMDRVFDKYPRKYEVGDMKAVFFRHKLQGIRCAVLDPTSSLIEPDKVKEFFGDQTEHIYKLT